MFVDSPTPIDLRFRLLGFPCVVGGLFWVGCVLLSGIQLDGPESLKLLLIWVACVFVSILLHELGHAVMARRFGSRVQLVKLTMMGGYCQYDREPPTYPQRILVNLGGIMAQFALAGLLKLGDQLIQLPDRLLDVSIYLRAAYEFLLFINIFWAVFNLLPVLPLDGGNVLRNVLLVRRVKQAEIKARWTGVVVASLFALLCFAFATGTVPPSIARSWLLSWFCPSILNGVFMGLLAFANWSELQALRARASFAGGWGDDGIDDGEAWKRR